MAEMLENTKIWPIKAVKEVVKMIDIFVNLNNSHFFQTTDIMDGIISEYGASVEEF